MLRSLDPFVVYLKEAMRDSETGSQRALTPQHKQQEERLRCPTLSLVALPNEGDILTSTQVLGMGRGMDDKNKIAELASRGFKILRVKLVTLEEDCGFALVSLWRERTEEDTKSRRFRSKAPAG